MSNFTPSVHFITEFDGDTVEMDLNRLQRKTFVAWSQFFEFVDLEKKTMRPDKALELISSCADTLEEYVHNFRGLNDAEGKSLGLKIVVDEAYFFGLLQRIVQELMTISTVKEPDEEDVEGKSDGPQPEATMA